MKTLPSLQRQARWTTARRGHRLSWDSPHPHNRGEVQQGTCRWCGCYVQLNTRPLPNEIDIGGSALAVSCFHTSLKAMVARHGRLKVAESLGTLPEVVMEWENGLLLDHPITSPERKRRLHKLITRTRHDDRK